MEAPLSDKVIKELKLQLEERHLELRQDIHGKLVQSRQGELIELAGRVRDVGDDSVASLLMDMDIAHVEQEASELKEIEDALERIRRNSFGQCEDCGVSIPVARLQANPIARRCTDCQSKRENNRSDKDATPSL